MTLQRVSSDNVFDSSNLLQSIIQFLSYPEISKFSTINKAFLQAASNPKVYTPITLYRGLPDITKPWRPTYWSILQLCEIPLKKRQFLANLVESIDLRDATPNEVKNCFVAAHFPNIRILTRVFISIVKFIPAYVFRSCEYIYFTGHQEVQNYRLHHPDQLEFTNLRILHLACDIDSSMFNGNAPKLEFVRFDKPTHVKKIHDVSGLWIYLYSFPLDYLRQIPDERCYHVETLVISTRKEFISKAE